MGSKVAAWFTTTMATWKFIFGILLVCVIEIVGNAKGWFHFDPTMIVLNTILSLWAAVQGSIIMINQNEADKKRDAMLKQILKIEKKIMKEGNEDGKIKVQYESRSSKRGKNG